MEQIDKKLLDRLQTLSKLNIEESKKSDVLNDLNRFLEFVDILNELDVKDLDATFSTLEGGAPLRKDIPIIQEDVSKKILKNAPKSLDNFFIVPKIIE